MSHFSRNTFNYELTITEIETIISQIEQGTLSLEEVFQQFAIATHKLKDCEKFLQIGKEKMNLLIEVLEDEPGEIEF